MLIFEDDHKNSIGSFNQFSQISTQNKLTTGEIQNKIRLLRAEIKSKLDLIELLLDQWETMYKEEKTYEEN